jgi:hypothetical protein
MIPAPKALVNDFVDSVRDLLTEPVDSSLISHELLSAPHSRPRLPRGKCAVYVFSLTQGVQCPAGANRVLKVGKVGPKSAPRFEYQHYKRGSANSTVAGAIENNRLLWNYLGVGPDVADFGEWLRRYTDRDHFFIDASRNNLVGLLEVYLKAVLGPVFEGSLKDPFAASVGS